MEYEQFVKSICGTDLYKLNPVEKDGALAIACMIVFLKSGSSHIKDIADHLKINVDVIERAYKRLVVNGIFSSSYGANKDPALLGQADEKSCRTAWCYIAGIGSGFCGLLSNR